MSVKFIVDSASDILPEEAEKLGIVHVPLTVMFGAVEYRDAVDFTHEQFYEMLIENDTHPTTSQIPPAVFEEIYSKYAVPGDELVVITISGSVSGTYQSAVIAAADFDNVYVVDSQSAAIGERILVLRGLEYAKQGLSASEIKEKLDAEKKKIRVMALLDTLEYLKKGGRISSAAALAGSVLGIKPVIAFEDGEVTVVGKARGSKQGNNLLRELIKKCGGIDFTRPVYLAYSGLSDKMLQKYIADSAELWQDSVESLPVATVGCAIGTHAGPGAIAVAFFEK